MTWERICHLPIEDAETEGERKAEHEKRVAEREQVITTEHRPAHQDWLAHLVGDWRCGHGDSPERAIGDLWLMYSHEIIERCKAL